MIVDLLALAFALAMDATATAATLGFIAGRVRGRDLLLTTLAFGGSQALMPLLGWWLGFALSSVVTTWDHWIAFVLLAGIGVHLLREAAAGPAEGAERSRANLFGVASVLWLALVTSIDALAAGVTLPLLGAPIVISVTVIGVTTAALSGGGLLLGRRLGRLLGKRLEFVGGLVLILLGLKILVEHTLLG
jgi:putative Mn2+ efflux pump MntP